MSVQVMSSGVKRGGPVRMGLLAVAVALSLSACTTVEGTNAFTDVGTFEREVVRSTLQGVGMVPREEKDPVVVERNALVMPPAGSAPPAPQQSAAVIPQDSRGVVVDSSGLTQADLAMLSQGRVIGSNATSGRPLTDAETRMLAARMAAYRQAQGQGQRSIYLPPENYFQRVGGQDLICLAPNGDLVSVTDPSCPPEVRAALSNR